MLQENGLLPAADSDRADKIRNTIRVATIFGGAVLIVMAFFVYTAVQFGGWQMYSLVGLSFAALTAIFFSIRILRRGRLEVGAWGVITGALFIFLGVPFLVAELGLVLGINVILLISMIAPQALPQRQANLAVGGSVVVALAAVILDLIAPAYRLSMPGLQTVLPVISIVSIAFAIFLIARQFSTYSLRTKLIVSFLFISILSVSVVAFSSTQTLQQQLQQDEGENLYQLARIQGQAIGDILVEQVSVMEAYRHNQDLQNRVISANSAYFEKEDLTAEQVVASIKALDTIWREAENDDAIILSRLNNPLAVDLLRFRWEFPEHTEIFVTDRYGALLAATNRTSDYYQADEEWWQAAYNQGQGAVFIGSPDYDESSDTFGLIIAVPIFAPRSGQAVGVLRSIYNFDTIIDLLGSIGQDVSGSFHLYAHGAGTTHQHQDDVGGVHDFVAQQAHQLVPQVQSSPLDYAELEYDGAINLLSYAPVLSVNQEDYIKDLEWGILGHKSASFGSFTTQSVRNNIMLSLLVSIMAAIVAVVVAQRIANPIVGLTETAQSITEGDYSQRATINTRDEVGALATSFNTMADQLQYTIGNLEERVSERTRVLELVMGLNRRLSGILNVNVLMQELVSVTKETFDYYHVHIYLLDETRENLEMMEGYGQAGQQMKSEGHHIPFDHAASIVALAARNNSAVVVGNVREDPNWLPNELLPETQSEMAVPITLEGRVEGVLDVQSERVGGLTGNDSLIMQALADQVAIAIRNARLFGQTEQALQQAQQLQNFYTHQAWDRFGRIQQTTDFEVRQSETVAPLDQVSTPEAVLAIQEQQTVNLRLPATRSSAPGSKEQNGDPQAGSHNVVATPLRIGDQVIGVLGVQDENERRQWSEDEIALIEAVSEQMSLALENARLFSESRQQAAREEIIANLTQAIWEGDDLRTVLRNTVSNLGDTLKASKVVLRLHAEQDNDR